MFVVLPPAWQVKTDVLALSLVTRCLFLGMFLMTYHWGALLVIDCCDLYCS